MNMKLKILIGALILVALVEGFWIKLTLSRPPVGISGYVYSDPHTDNPKNPDDSISVRGTWRSDTDLAAKINRVELICEHAARTCSEAVANVIDGTLVADSTTYTIEEWTNDEVKASNAGLCGKSEITINRKIKEVTALDSKTGTGGLCDAVPAQPTSSYIGDGFPVYSQLSKVKW